VVDYLGLADELKQRWRPTRKRRSPARRRLDQDDAVALMLEKYEICEGLFTASDLSTGPRDEHEAAGSPDAHACLRRSNILEHEDGKARLLRAVN
jgi:type I restriction enzyme R subunit